MNSTFDKISSHCEWPSNPPSCTKGHFVERRSHQTTPPSLSFSGEGKPERAKEQQRSDGLVGRGHRPDMSGGLGGGVRGDLLQRVNLSASGSYVQGSGTRVSTTSYAPFCKLTTQQGK